MRRVMEFEPISLCNEGVARVFLRPFATSIPQSNGLALDQRIPRLKEPWPKATSFKSACVRGLPARGLSVDYPHCTRTTESIPLCRHVLTDRVPRTTRPG
jgi:hypothetical protein